MRERDVTPPAVPDLPPDSPALASRRVGGCLVCRGPLLETLHLVASRAGGGLSLEVVERVRCGCDGVAAAPVKRQGERISTERPPRGSLPPV